MDKISKKALNEKIKLPFIVVLIGVVVLIVGMFLPYMSASGEMAEYIEANPDRIEIKDLGLTASDLKDIPLISVSKLITGIYGEDDGAIANVFVLVFSGFLALTALFTIFKKPIAIIIFNLFTCGTFALLNFSMKEDFIDPDKYAWGIGNYAITFAFFVVLAGAIWMFVKKIIAKKELKAQVATQPIE